MSTGGQNKSQGTEDEPSTPSDLKKYSGKKGETEEDLLDEQLLISQRRITELEEELSASKETNLLLQQRIALLESHVKALEERSILLQH